MVYINIIYILRCLKPLATKMFNSTDYTKRKMWIKLNTYWVIHELHAVIVTQSIMDINTLK